MANHQISFEEARENLLACAAFLAERIKSSDGHAAAMSEIVPRYLEKGQVDLAAELANSVDDPFTRDKLLMQVAEKCAATDDDEYAFQLVESIEDFGTQAQARERVVLQKSAKGEFAKALEIAETLDHSDFVIADIAFHQAENGDEENAFQTLERIEFPNARIAALQNIAAFYLKKDEAAKAVQMLEKAVEICGEIEFAEEKVRALIEIGNHFTEANRNGSAIETFDKAKVVAEQIAGVHRDAFLASVALGFLRAGSVELADRTLDLVTDKVQMASALIGFAREFRGTDEIEALETLEEAYAILKSQRDNEIRDSQARFGLFGTLAVEFAQVGKAERAVEIAQEIADENSQISALSQIAQVCTLQNKDEIARQAVNAIGEESQKMFALIGVSDAKNKAGKSEEALDFLREAETLCETVPQFASRSAAYNEIAERFYNYGESEKAVQVIHENLQTIFAIRDESSRAAALAQLSDLYESKKIALTETERKYTQALIQNAS